MTSSSEAAAGRTPPEPSLLTATVEQGALQAEVVARGTLQRDSEIGLIAWPPSDPTVGAVVTLAPLQIGHKVNEGELVLEIGGRPVIALTGALPAFRDLKLGDAGPDVDQLREALERLGLLDDPSPGPFDQAMVEAVGDLYRSLGYHAQTGGPEAQRALLAAQEELQVAKDSVSRIENTGTGGRAMLLEAEAAIRAAEHALSITDAETGVALENAERHLLSAKQEVEAAGALLAIEEERLLAAERDGRHPDTGEPPTDEQLDQLRQVARDASSRMEEARELQTLAEQELVIAQLRRQADLDGARAQVDIAQAQLRELLDGFDAPDDALAQAQRTLEATTRAVEDAERDVATYLPRSEVVYVSTLPRPVTATLARRGDDVDGPFARVSSTELFIESSVPASSVTAIKLGTVGMADDLNADISFGVEVVDISSAPQIEGAEAGRFLVRLAPLETPPEHAIGLSLRIRIPTETSSDESLVVPVTALFTGLDGYTMVERIDGERTQPVQVQVGLTASGLAVIEPLVDGAVSLGDRVVVGLIER